MPKIFLTGYIDVPEARRALAHDALPQHIALTRAEPGCLRFDVTEDETSPGRYLVSELFDSRVDFDAHQMRAAQSPWAAVTAGIPRHYTIEEVSA
ncbi:Quinol monooxygenase YgiN [Aliiroseovarius sediminilitoris]|uniref:Quinol monooxygenase YgiN n=1 Tax=Aliiroseovarius sediminilitoris TaxID=1173584 RepID=A0A1I0PSX5_9RHOB|nr:antibiotic biosynthesis monooxygenase [Aliiroseovarius sediminilitoris]SEW17396.1 Quinol monooxygenase YgiN [Aliiroseovarius sediminilitoris]